MSRKIRTIIAVSLGSLTLISLLVYCGVVNRLSVPLFWLGVRHGVEDKQRGTVYGNESPVWRMVPKDGNWKGPDALLVRKFTADETFQQSNVSIFMTGYRLGYNLLMIVLFVVILIVGTVIIEVRDRRSRLNQPTALSDAPLENPKE